MKRIVLIFSMVLATSVSFGQITVQNTQTVADLITNVLAGAGVTPFNITVNGSPALANTVQPAVSYFNQNATPFPITEGVLMTTGVGNIAVGPNASTNASNGAGTTAMTDPDMAVIANPGTPTNGIVIEFDFVATGNYLEFRYIFASEEYPEFAPPQGGVNDAFGFFLSGTGLNGPFSLNAENIAVVPGTTTPVSIDNVNAITNQTYYVDNAGGAAFGNAVEYDGATVGLTAVSDLVCGDTFHIKLGITNVLDDGWDSGVFLEAGSFTTNPIGFGFDSFAQNNTVSEGCSQQGTIIFTREGCDTLIQTDSLIAYIDYGGTATNGVDFSQLDDSVLMLPGVDTVIWIVNPFNDGLPEGTESIEMTITTILPSGDTIVSTGTFFITDPLEVSVTANDTALFCLTDSANVAAIASGGYEPYVYSWDNGVPDSAFTFQPTSNGTTEFIVTVTDACGFTDVDTSTVSMNETLSIDTIISQNASACIPDGFASAFVSGIVSQGGQPFYNWTGPGGPPGPISVDGTVIEDIPSGWYYFTVLDDVCEKMDSVFIDIENPPIAQFSANPTSGCSPLNVVITNTSQNTVNYDWDFGNGNIASVTDMNPINQTYTTSGVITLIASDNSGCADTTTVTISVVLCGCTDPQAVNHNPNAIQDDGSCVYPVPEVDAPNVITPDGDNVNDVFFLNTENTLSVKLTITNRWGNLIFEAEGDNPIWNGTDLSGEPVSQGVYFYSYVATGTADQTVEGHGFVHVE